MTNFLGQLLPPGIEQAELEQVIQQYFSSSRAATPDEVTYPGHETEYALKLTYEDGALVAITEGPRLARGDLDALTERITQELIAQGEERIGCAVLFSSVPVEGAFSYRDALQIIPAPPDAPRPPFQLGEHPFLLEFRFPSSPNWTIRNFRRLLRARELELILSALLEFGISSISPISRHRWVLTNPDDLGNWQTRYLQEMYTWRGERGELDEFTAIAGLSELLRVDAAVYYSRTGIGADRRLELPGNIEDLLDKIFALPSPARDRFLRACFWFRHARKIYLDSRSAAYTAVISAIETLMPPQRGSGLCERCGRSMGPGPTQQFADFVERYASGSGLSAGERKRIYAIRSALSHGGTLLHSDRSGWSPALTQSNIQEREDIDTAWRLVRAILVNWGQ